jgi:hypothetical protein
MLAALTLAGVLAAGITRPEAREEASPGGALDYAYFTLQGRLTDPSLRQALQGATIRLTSGEESFETITDPKGLFVFEKLPVASYSVQVISAEGQVVREIRRLDAGDPFRQKLRMKLGRGVATSFQVHAAEESITLDVPQPEVRWDRFWKELALFVGGAALLAL